MEENQANPISQPDSPLPSWPEDQQLSDWEEYSKVDLYSLREVEGYKEQSDWEESIGQELSEVEDSVGQDFSKGNGNRPSVQSSWEDDSDNELARDIWEHVSVQSLGVKPLLREDDDWDELSDLELSEQEDREQRRRHFAEDELLAPVPREAWVEHQEPCPQVPCSAWPPCHPVAALQSCSSPSAPQLPAKAPHKRRRSRVRWVLCALRSLCCPWPCLSSQPED